MSPASIEVNWWAQLDTLVCEKLPLGCLKEHFTWALARLSPSGSLISDWRCAHVRALRFISSVIGRLEDYQRLEDWEIGILIHLISTWKCAHVRAFFYTWTWRGKALARENLQATFECGGERSWCVPLFLATFKKWQSFHFHTYFYAWRWKALARAHWQATFECGDERLWHGQNIHTVYLWYLWQGNHRIHSHIRRIYTVLANLVSTTAVTPFDTFKANI
jgi:hypothetical protein